MGTTTRERIDVILGEQDWSQLSAVEQRLLDELERAVYHLMTVKQEKADALLGALDRLRLLEREESLANDVLVTRNTLAYLGFRRRQQQEAAFREELRNLGEALAPSPAREVMINDLTQRNDREGMRRLLGSLMDTRGRLIVKRDEFQAALQRTSLGSFDWFETHLSWAEDTIAEMENDILLLNRLLV